MPCSVVIGEAVYKLIICITNNIITTLHQIEHFANQIPIPTKLMVVVGV